MPRRHPVPPIRLVSAGFRAATTAIAAAAVAAAAIAAPVTPADPVAVDHLPERLERIVDRLESLMAEHHVPGAAVAIVVGGEPVLVRGLGVRDRSTGEPVTAGTLFAIGSATKSMTGLLAAAEALEGGVPLDAPVAEVLPELTFHDPETTAAITLADLLSHTSGVMRTDLLWYGGYADWNDILAAFAKAEPVADLGEAFHYQNVLYLAAGRIIGEKSRRGWEGLLETRILRPVGMAATGIDAEELRGPQGARGHDWAELGKYAVRDAEGRPVLPWVDPAEVAAAEDGSGWWRLLEPRDLSNIAPAGAVNSTAEDMARWVAFVLRRGVTADGERVMPEAAFEEAWTPRIDIVPGMSYGLGFMIRQWRDHRLLEHGGNIDGYSAQVAWLPEAGIGFAVMANLGTTPMTTLATEAIFGGLLDPWAEASDEAGVAGAEAGGGESAADLERFVGRYDASLLFGRPVSVLLRDGGLAMDVPGQITYRLEPPDDEGLRRFAGFPDIAARFVTEPAAADGGGEPPAVRSVELHQGGLIFEWLREGASYPVEVPLDSLTPLVGRYRDAAASRTFTILVRQNRLAMAVPGETTYFLRPPDAEGWWVLRETDQLAVRFEPAEGGEAGDPAAAITVRGPGGQGTLPREAGGDALPDAATLEWRVQATQGRDAWDRRLNVRLRGRVRLVNQGLEGACSLDLAGFDRLRDRLDLGLFGWMETGMFGRRAWFDASFQPFAELPEDAAAMLGQLHPALPMADWRQVFNTVAVLARRESGDRRLLEVQGQREGLRPVTWLVDEASGLVHSVETAVLVPGMGMMPRTVTFEDYREIEGVRLPMRITTDDPGLGRVERVYETWEIDPEIGQEVFRKHDPAG
ncbi:MAG: serine hydrolase domain-containing protein [Planctomycetota bacterium]|jgi:CubicO group peptidase (beta-lactamase class C family)